MHPRPRRAAALALTAAALHLGAATRADAAPATDSGAARPAASASKPDPRRPDPKTSKSDPGATKPGLANTGKTDAKPDPKSSKTEAPNTNKPEAKPDPKASKTGARADPKTSKPGVKPDPKTSKPDAGADPKTSKPDPKTSKPEAKADPKASSPAAPPPDPKTSPIPPAPADGYWLGARLLGPADAQAAALRALAADLPPGPVAAGMVGRAATLAEAVQWVARWLFSSDPLPPPVQGPADLPLHQGPVPRPGGALWTAHGVVVHGLTITGRSGDGGTRDIRWPQTAAEIVPPGLPWVSAVLLADRAPLFAAPASHVPPASERYALVRRSGSLFILGHADRCTHATGERVCLRWAQVVARDGDSFRGGYLPAHQVARVDAWVRGSGQNPRVQLLAAGTAGASAQFVLVARTRDGGLHRRTLVAPMVGDAYPAARVRVDGEWATVEFTGLAAQRIALDASLDARIR